MKYVINSRPRLMLVCVAILTLAAAASSSFAATRSWRGYASSAWATAGNWKEGAVPTSSDDVIFDSTAINQPSYTTGFPNAGGLSLNSITVSVDSIVLSFSSGTAATDSIVLSATPGLTINASSKLVMRTPGKSSSG